MKPDTRNLLVTTAVIWLAGGGVYFLGNSLPGAKAPPAHESAEAEEPSSPKPPAAIALSAPPAEPAPAAPAPAPAATASVDELLTLSKDPKQWVSPTGDYANLRHSGLKQITADNVGSLQPAWQFSTGVLRGHEGAPLVLNNVSVTDSSGKTLTTDVMYLHTPFPNIVYALDAKDPAHQILWKYEPKQDPSVVPVMCCDTVNRGLAYGDGKIFLAQADTTLIALDAKTGKLVWSVKNGDPAKGQTSTAAPHVFKDKVLVGIAGGEFGVRGHITAYSIKDGKQVWRGYSMGPDADTLIEPGKTTHLGKPVEKDSGITTWEGNQWETGGGTTWGWYSYDPELNQIFYGSGNPSTWNPVQRPGDNRWSMTLWSRDLDTGKVKWVYQMTPHDEWDYDGINEVILADQNIGGKTVKTAVHFDRNGFAYTLDRTNGELLVAEKYDPAVNWATKVDLDKSSKTYGRRWSSTNIRRSTMARTRTRRTSARRRWGRRTSSRLPTMRRRACSWFRRTMCAWTMSRSA